MHEAPAPRQEMDSTPTARNFNHRYTARLGLRDTADNIRFDLAQREGDLVSASGITTGIDK